MARPLMQARGTLARRLFTTLLTMSIVSAVIAIVSSAVLDHTSIMGEALHDLNRECEVVASTLDASDDEVAELSNLELGEMRATLVSPEGEVLFDSQVSSTGLVSHEDRPEIAQALAKGEGSSIRASSSLGNVSIYRALRLDSGNVVRLSQDRAGIFALLIGDISILILILIALAAVSWVVSRKLAGRLVEPILRMDVGDLIMEAPYEELAPLTSRLAEQQEELFSQMEDLRMSELARSEFTANVTHELKTPIASIMGASELLRDGYVLEEDVPDFAARIHREAQRLADLVNDILTLSRLDESERVGSRELMGVEQRVDLMATAQDVSRRMAGRADLADVSIEVTGESVVVLGFPHLLDDLVANLCSNAVRYNRPGGSVTIWVGMRDDAATVEVSDTGMGIPEAAQAKVFERFYRVEPSRSRDSGGTGLGLAIVKHVANLHNAQITLQSTLGEGTTVTVSFPERRTHAR